MTQLHVLLIEDDTLTRMALSGLLTYDGYTVTEASSCQEVQNMPLDTLLSMDIIVCDINLGNGNPTEGYDMLRWLRGKSYEGKIVLMTGYEQDWIKRQLENRGLSCDLVITKPAKDFSHAIQSLMQPQ